MTNIPLHNQGPKYVTKTVTVDPAVWAALVALGVNMSELVRLKLDEVLRELEAADRSQKRR